MSLKTLACVSMAACGLMFSATDAPAQSWWNPLNVFNRPAYGGYNSGMNCANGVCTPKPVYNAAYGSNFGAANCVNGNCNANCANGSCNSFSKCGPGGCGTNSLGYGSNYRVPSYGPVMPSYRTTPAYFETQRLPMPRTSNYRVQPTGYGRSNPFYP